MVYVYTKGAPGVAVVGAGCCTGPGPCVVVVVAFVAVVVPVKVELDDRIIRLK